VRGSGGRVYQCIVQLQRDDSGELTVVGQCSCPVGYNCKHVAATLLSLGDRSAQRSQPDASSGLPPEVRNWLSHVERVAASAAYDNPQRLLYLLRCEERFGLKQILVHVVRIRQLAAGGYGKPQDYNISAQSRAGFTPAGAHRAPPGCIRVPYPLPALAEQGPERRHRRPLLGRQTGAQLVPQCCPDLRIRPLRDRRSPRQEGDARTRGAGHVVGERA